MIHTFRVLLIRIAKVLPFILCSILVLSYSESVYAILCQEYSSYGNFVVPEKLISWFIANYFEYEWTTLIVLIVLSVSVETCIYNKMACAYLGINLAEKSYFDFEMDVWLIYAICLANILVAGYLTFKGIRIARRK